MSRIRPALPLPPQVLCDKNLAYGDPVRQKQKIHRLSAELDALFYQAEVIKAKLAILDSSVKAAGKSQAETVKTGNFSDIQLALPKLTPYIGHLIWNDNLDDEFSGVGESPGNVSGQPWAIGFMLTNTEFLIPASCFSGTGGGWQWPTRRGMGLTPNELLNYFSIRIPYPEDEYVTELDEYSGFDGLEKERIVPQGYVELEITAMGPETTSNPGLIRVRTKPVDHDLTLQTFQNTISKFTDDKTIKSDGYIVELKNPDSDSFKTESWTIRPVTLINIQNYSNQSDQPTSNTRPGHNSTYRQIQQNTAPNIPQQNQIFLQFHHDEKYFAEKSLEKIDQDLLKRNQLGSPILTAKGELFALYIGPVLNSDFHIGVII